LFSAARYGHADSAIAEKIAVLAQMRWTMIVFSIDKRDLHDLREALKWEQRQGQGGG
jgi:hypothetical protein